MCTLTVYGVWPCTLTQFVTSSTHHTDVVYFFFYTIQWIQEQYFCLFLFIQKRKSSTEKKINWSFTQFPSKIALELLTVNITLVVLPCHWFSMASHDFIWQIFQIKKNLKFFEIFVSHKSLIQSILCLIQFNIELKKKQNFIPKNMLNFWAQVLLVYTADRVEWHFYSITEWRKRCYVK